ncbi:MAG: hypothetical protein U0791_12920 [Gemmataceae bacterium]
MVRACAFLAIVALLISWSGVCRAEDKIIGAIWQVNYKNDQGKYVSFGLIRCTVDGKVFIDGKEVGTHKNTGFEMVELEITNSPIPGVNGKSKATKVKKDGTVWEGVHKRADGKEVPIRMFLKKD